MRSWSRPLAAYRLSSCLAKCCTCIVCFEWVITFSTELKIFFQSSLLKLRVCVMLLWLKKWLSAFYISALNRGDAQTVVIAATSWAMLFEEIIMDLITREKGFGYILQSIFFPFTVFPPLWKQLLKTAPHNYLSICPLWVSVMSSSNFKSLIDKWIIIGWKMFWVSAWILDCGNFQLFWGMEVCVCSVAVDSDRRGVVNKSHSQLLLWNI